MNHVYHSSRARGTGIFLHTSLPSTRNMNAKVAVELYYIFSKMSDAEYTNFDEARDYVVRNVLNPRDLVFRPDLADIQ